MGEEDMRRFIDLMKVQNDNLEILREDEAFLDRTLMQLAAAIAYDCGQWPDPDRYVSPNVEVVTSAARYGALLREEWQTKGGLLVFGGGTSIEEGDWTELMEKGKNLQLMLLAQHLDAYGRETDEAVTTAYRETNTCLTYMTGAACARSTDLDASLRYFEEAFAKYMSRLTE